MKSIKSVAMYLLRSKVNLVAVIVSSGKSYLKEGHSDEGKDRLIQCTIAEMQKGRHSWRSQRSKEVIQFKTGLICHLINRLLLSRIKLKVHFTFCDASPFLGSHKPKDRRKRVAPSPWRHSWWYSQTIYNRRYGHRIVRNTTRPRWDQGRNLYLGLKIQVSLRLIIQP